MPRTGLMLTVGLLATTVIFAATASFVSAQARATDPKENVSTYPQRKAYYDSTIGRPSLRWKVRGIVTLGSGSDPEAIDVLVARHAKPEPPSDHIRYAIANVFGQYFDDAAHSKRLTSFALTLKEQQDAWMWYNTDLIEGKRIGYDGLVAIAKNEKLPMLRRATAVYAMKDAGQDYLLTLIKDLLTDAKMPKGDRDHSLFLESMSFALMNSGAEKSKPEYEAAFDLIGKHFDEKKTPERTKFVMGRHFARLYGIDDVYINFDGWRREHIGFIADAGRSGRSGGTSVPRKVPEFMGIKGSGKHVAYIIDMSDSMLTKVNKPKAKPKPKEEKGPITGGKRKPKEPEPELTDEERLPWDKITNRFELAREYLKLSLDRLTPDMTFTVVVFGTQAENIKVTKGMVKATPQAIGQVKKFFDDYKVGSRSQIKPLGTLMGDTNIHGGFLRAFESNSSGAKPKFEYVDEVSFLNGCDTIFLLSDGDPNVDDFVVADIWEQGVRVVNDRENPTEVAKVDTINYQGPYAQPDWLLLDLRRLNLFRHAEIHTLGMGAEAKEGLLRAIADQGYGKCKMVGNFD